MATKKANPSWTDVKAKLANFDRAGLLVLVQDLYASSKDAQNFLHTRLLLGEDVLKPYKATIDRWLWPDVFKNQDSSVANAKKAISDYKKAIGHPTGIAELSLFYCEEAVGLLSWCGMDDESYYAALVRMFDQAVTAICGLPEAERAQLLERLEHLRSKAGRLGWGLKDAFDESWFSVVE